MLRKLQLLLFLFSFILLNAQTDQDSAWIRDNYTKKEITIPMRDGVKLFTAVYMPKDNCLLNHGKQRLLNVFYKHGILL